ncbi:NHLP leader peptide family RiPP precursor [Nostoc sp. CMAA1605]|uniref:NHLP leader peptide family RiPP precursor n=1 Tax=Nostoc sp. CMAA1605 TaxID=2055159 RepID=UPI001F20BCE6|nr:NHLP leader peptide family RiPP precursor [Nostoc sp. CMAA1605]MCF4965702.1 NHLP leader peptide family natural product precursor [Nostoc sp. CMAA1605]
MSEQEQILENSQENLEAKIIARAWKNDAYKQELLENPKAVIAREFNVELPAEVSVQVLEETPTNLYFVLPMRPQFEAGELADVSEEELEMLAGASAAAISRAVSISVAITKNWSKQASNAVSNATRAVSNNKSVQYTGASVVSAGVSAGVGGGGKR